MVISPPSWRKFERIVAGAEVHPLAEDRVPDVVEVRNVGAGEEDRPLHLDVGADHRAVTDPAAAAQVGADPDLDVAADPDRALENHARGDPAAGADRDAVAEQADVGRERSLDRLRGQLRRAASSSGSPRNSQGRSGSKRAAMRRRQVGEQLRKERPWSRHPRCAALAPIAARST